MSTLSANAGTNSPFVSNSTSPLLTAHIISCSLLLNDPTVSKLLGILLIE